MILKIRGPEIDRFFGGVHLNLFRPLIALCMAVLSIAFSCGKSSSGDGNGETVDNPAKLPEDSLTVWIGGMITSVNGSDCRSLGYVKSGVAKCFNITSPVTSSNPIRRILKKDTNIFVSGRFSSIDGVATGGIAKYNGEFWAGLGSNFDALGGHVVDIAIKSDSEIFATSITNTSKVWKFDGTTWMDLNFPSTDVVRSIAITRTGDLIAVTSYNASTNSTGPYVVYKFSGSTWSNIGAANGSINVVRIDSSGSIVIAGDFTTINGSTTGKIAKFAGSSWQAVGNLQSGTVYELQESITSKLWIAGTNLPGGSVNFLENGTWKGTSSVLNGITFSIDFDSTGNPITCGNSSMGGTTQISGVAKLIADSWAPVFTLGRNGCEKILVVN